VFPWVASTGIRYRSTSSTEERPRRFQSGRKMGKESKEGGGGGKEHKKEGKGTAGGEGGVPPTMSGKSLQPSPTSREFVFFPQLLRGENEPANPPVRCWALCPGGEEQERPECRPVGVCVCTESRAPSRSESKRATLESMRPFLQTSTRIGVR